MKTYEMVALAKENGRTYRTSDMYYNTMQGFHDSDGAPWGAEAYSYDANGLNDFIEEDKWEEVETEYVVTRSMLKSIFLDYISSFSDITISISPTFIPDETNVVDKILDYIVARLEDADEN